jgi:hypothetical protein
MIRYEYTMQLIQNTEKSLQINNVEKAFEYIEEVNRISGYHGRVKELYLHTCKIIVDLNFEQLLNKCRKEEVIL